MSTLGYCIGYYQVQLGKVTETKGSISGSSVERAVQRSSGPTTVSAFSTCCSNMCELNSQGHLIIKYGYWSSSNYIHVKQQKEEIEEMHISSFEGHFQNSAYTSSGRPEYVLFWIPRMDRKWGYFS